MNCYSVLYIVLLLSSLTFYVRDENSYKKVYQRKIMRNGAIKGESEKQMGRTNTVHVDSYKIDTFFYCMGMGMTHRPHQRR